MKEKFAHFTNFNFGVYGGVNFESISEVGGVFLLEVKTNLSAKINMKFSIGYSNAYMLTSYNVKTNREINIDSIASFLAITYDTYKKGYDLFPIFLGFQYVFKYNVFSPYVLLDFGYNYFTTKKYNSPQQVRRYNSFDELPEEYKTKHIEKLTTNSFGASIGVGTFYQITAKLNLDFRYYYKYDNEIINTHNFIIGINF